MPVGAISWLEDRGYAVFEYEPNFLNTGLDISPLHMGLDVARSSNRVFSFPELNKQTYLGLPGLVADALPDKFGNSIIDAWLARNGRDPGSFSPVERLCYTGKRGMGALEFFPPFDHQLDRPVPIEITTMAELVDAIISKRKELNVEFTHSDTANADAIVDILRIGTSAGGARPKAIIAINKSGSVISGQGEVPADYEYWLLKFDGVTDLELGNPKGYGLIEYAYYLMAKAAGIEMMECRLLHENGRSHFLTKRFDRQNKEKIHMQSLCGLAHYDFNMAGAYSYEQVFAVMRKLHLTKAEAIQQYRRMLFNVMARNQDDHTKNIVFLMGKTGTWYLSPAFDVIYSHNPRGKWTNQHQMSINGKRDHFTLDDLLTVASSISLSKPIEIINEVQSAVVRWPEFAKEAGVDHDTMIAISQYHRLNL